jgi:uncharacterized protein (TIGR02001 family)
MIQRFLPVALVLAAGPAAAQTAPELSFGFAVTSNYIFRGTTQSNDNPAVQGYVEGAYGMLYGGVWASTVDIDDDSAEFDLYAGVRPSFGDLSVDVSYVRYLYDDTGDCCGEIALGLGYPMADLGELGAKVWYDPVADTTWAEAAMSVGIVAEFEVGGTIGTDFDTLELGEGSKVAWDLGISRGLGDFANVDLRYYDSNYDPDTVVLSIGADF